MDIRCKQSSHLFFLFFFSSRRRHTRLQGDWSSDVCSSDLDEPSVLATVPMWFGLLDEKNSSAMITQLADSDQQTDWGMRIISDRSLKFSGGDRKSVV